VTALKVLAEGVELPDEEARAMWRRFSAWMDANVGDLAGFAQTEGFASLHPEMHEGSPVLVASRTAGQRPYVTAPKRGGGPGAPPKKSGGPGRGRKGRQGRP
jgi:hypothetical protein